MIGGIFAGLMAPHLFNGIDEYPILIAGAAVRCPASLPAASARRWPNSGPGWCRARSWRWSGASPFAAASDAGLPFQVLLALLAAAMLFLRQRPMRVLRARRPGLCLTALVAPGDSASRRRAVSSASTRGRVADGKARILYHGTTIHGAERVRDADGKPVTGRRAADLLLFRRADRRSDRRRLRRAGGSRMLPLSGSAPGRSLAIARRRVLDFFEIDPEVVRLARDRASSRSCRDARPMRRSCLAMHG